MKKTCRKSFFIENEQIPKLTDELSNSCEGLITKEECEIAIKSMSNFKTPGSDGIPIEFYKLLWNDISDLVLNSFKYSYENDQLSISQKQGIITLLPKKDKNTKYIKNWRPISLLNTDYKIMTKVIAFRMKKVLSTIIHTNQSGFLKDRYIGSNIRLLLDIIDYTNNEQQPGMIFAIDFEKALTLLAGSF